LKLSECNFCGLHKRRQEGLVKQVVLPLVHGTAPNVFFLGEAPGKHEDEQGIPFVDSGPGSAGHWHWKFAKALGVENSCIVMNTIQCRPAEKVGDIIKNGKPTIAQMQHCWPWVERTLQKYKIRLMILYGTYPIKQVLGFDSPISSFVGKFYEAEEVGRIKCFAAYHPASICYDKKAKLAIFKKHVKIIRKFLYT